MNTVAIHFFVQKINKNKIKYIQVNTLKASLRKDYPSLMMEDQNTKWKLANQNV